MSSDRVGWVSHWHAIWRPSTMPDRSIGGPVVPAVALQGVFKDRCVIEAQDTPMLILWGHRLDDLRDFIQASV